MRLCFMPLLLPLSFVCQVRHDSAPVDPLHINLLCPLSTLCVADWPLLFVTFVSMIPKTSDLILLSSFILQMWPNIPLFDNTSSPRQWPVAGEVWEGYTLHTWMKSGSSIFCYIFKHDWHSCKLIWGLNYMSRAGKVTTRTLHRAHCRSEVLPGFLRYVLLSLFLP